MKKQFKRGDIVEIAGKNKIRGTVLKVINDVVMLAPWDSAQEDILLASELRHIKGFSKKQVKEFMGIDTTETPRNY